MRFAIDKHDIPTNGTKKEAIPFIKMFLDNIKSNGLKDRFSKLVEDIMSVDLIDVWQRSIAGMHQEWKIFKNICPKEFIDMIKKEDKFHDEYMVLVFALEKLGFSNMSDDIYIMEYAKKFEDDNVSDEVFKKSYEYARMFIDNIKSDGMKDVFEVGL